MDTPLTQLESSPEAICHSKASAKGGEDPSNQLTRIANMASVRVLAWQYVRVYIGRWT